MLGTTKVSRDGNTITCTNEGHPVSLKLDLESAATLSERLTALKELDKLVPTSETPQLKFAGPWGYISILNTETLKGTVRIGNDHSFLLFPRCDYHDFALQLFAACLEASLPADTTPVITPEPIS